MEQLEGNKWLKGLSYEDLCMHPDIELLKGYKPPKFELYNGTRDPKVYLKLYCDKLVGVGKNEQILIQLFMKSLTGDALLWYVT